MSQACPRCGQQLPDHARFCARCGAQLAGPVRRVDSWVLVVLGIGTTLSAAGAVVYSAVAIDPAAGAASAIDPATIRAGSLLLAVGLAIICTLQGAAITGLVRGREWGRIVATVACVLWSLTCIGLPIALLVLNSLWRRRASAAI